ncbi:MAG: YbaB/EbfC family nucleoid-associated protein [Fidelibacterota bacterium]
MFNKGNMASLLKQAQEMQQKIQDVQAELDDLIVEAEAGGGMVKVVANGKMEILELTIADEAIAEDKELLEDLVISAVNNAIAKSQEESQKRMGSVTGNMLGGMKIPGI